MLRKLIVAAALAAVTTTLVAAPSFAGICNQQGKRVLMNGTWHKVVRYKSGWVDCGLGW